MQFVDAKFPYYQVAHVAQSTFVVSIYKDDF